MLLIAFHGFQNMLPLAWAGSWLQDALARSRRQYENSRLEGKWYLTIRLRSHKNLMPRTKISAPIGVSLTL
jgi:hypothetical protein